VEVCVWSQTGKKKTTRQQWNALTLQLSLLLRDRCLLCKFISPGACTLSFPSILVSFSKKTELSGSFIEASSEITRKMKSLQVEQRSCKDNIIGREITTQIKTNTSSEISLQLRAMVQ